MAVLSSHIPCPQEAGVAMSLPTLARQGCPGALAPSEPQCHHLGNGVIIMTLVSSVTGQTKLMSRMAPASQDALGAGVGPESLSRGLHQGRASGNDRGI